MTRTTSLLRGKPLTFGIALVLALLALAPGAWKAALAQTTVPPTQVTPTTVAVNPSATTTVNLNTTSTLVIPPGALPDGTTLTLEPLDTDTLPPLPEPEDEGTQVFVAAAFSIDLGDAEGTELDEPATFGFTLTDEQIAALDGRTPTALFFNEDTGEWEEGGDSCDPSVPSSWDPVTKVLTVTVCHFSDWVVIGETETAVDDGGVVPGPAETGNGVFEVESESGPNIALLIAAVAGLAAVVGVGARYARRRA